MPWPDHADELIELQRALGAERPEPWRGPARRIGGCFAAFPRRTAGPGARGDPIWAAAALAPATAAVRAEAGAPYEPGLLALRIGPALEAAVRRLDPAPDVLLVDATGRDHPRRAGLALHLGSVLDLPTVGVTHRQLLAEGPWPPAERGAHAPLTLDGEPVGAWLRIAARARPLAVHVAWRTDVDTAIAVVMAAAGRARTPEPLRAARHAARVARSRGA